LNSFLFVKHDDVICVSLSEKLRNLPLKLAFQYNNHSSLVNSIILAMYFSTYSYETLLN